MNRRLLKHCKGNKKDAKKIISQAESSPELIEFLAECFKEDVQLNIFTGTDGFIRGISDGKAQQATAYINLIRSLSYDQ